MAFPSALDAIARRRAAKACLSCRNRKVRCDVVSGGHPCTNCRLDGVGCTVGKSNRGRKPKVPRRPHQGQEPHGPQTFDSARQQSPSPSPAAPAAAAIPGQQQSVPSSPASHRPPDSDLATHGRTSGVADQHLQTPSSGSSPNPESVVESATRGQPLHPVETWTTRAVEHPFSSTSVTSSSGRDLHCTAQGRQNGLLPPYIRPLPRQLTAVDISYLASKYALHIPDREFVKELLRTYADVVHPFMPVLALESFVSPVLHEAGMGQGKSPVSLLVFQAVMFVSGAFVSADFIRSRGYGGRKAARKAFFGRVRLLYGLDCEPDRLAMLQSLMLMTYWYDRPEDEKDTWYWMGTALSIAQVLGFHRDPALLGVPPRERKLRTRIWWSCVIRDRTMALGLRRPVRIREEDFDTPLPTLDDFDLRPPAPDLAALMGPTSFTDPNLETRTALALMCIELSKLSLLMGRVVHSQYTVVGSIPTCPEGMLKVIVTPRAQTAEGTLGKYDAELEKWVQNLDQRCRYEDHPSMSSRDNTPAKSTLRLHRAILRMLYLTTVMVLHRPHAFQPLQDCAEEHVDAPDETQESGRQRISRVRVTETAVAMTGLVHELECSNQLRHLPHIAISGCLAAAIVHLFNIQSPNGSVQSLSIGRFYQCVQALQRLQVMYAAADYTMNFLGTVLRKTTVNIPGLGFSFPGVDSSHPDSVWGGEEEQAHPRQWQRQQMRPQLSSTTARYALNATDGGSVVDAPCPSAFGAGGNLARPQVPTEGDGVPLPTNFAHGSTSSLGLQHRLTETWHQDDNGIATDLPQVPLWSDYGALFPALFNFDAQANYPVLNTGPVPEPEAEGDWFS
ncbi:unnamed protein product [Clonostachys rosea]|uniref:Zn(2)-C6 fungal-type domain-containing protein n=1 Tax=Bionectria ochroleuca TaxID=29856 RepID=A0ABY6TYR1_BIOOC|nr:unnamed protein product [Clonostachys rosea]